MRKRKCGWKAPVLLLLALTLFLQMLELYHQTHGGAGQMLPVLMYHHFEETSKEGTVVSSARFREQVAAMHAAGFHAVSVPQVIAYVENGTPLPEKPVLITMDDGYTSNLTIAAPVLEEYGMCATVFVIGINEGEDAYVHSGEPFWQERFAYEEAAPWTEKGVIDAQSHTYDMHQLESYGYSGRDGVLQKDGESQADYRRALLEDAEACRQRRQGKVAGDLNALAYPFGYYSPEADEIMKEAGYILTVTIDDRPNRLRIGEMDCLRLLGRVNVTDRMSGQDVVDRLEQYSSPRMMPRTE